jgi:opacity protein-like surface antigen
MGKLSISTLAVAAFFAANSAAFGADLKGDPTSADYVAERPFSWTGFYIGGRLGYGNANHELSLKRYHGDYCFDQYGSQLSDDEVPVNSTVAPEDTFNPFETGLPFKVNTAGTCANEKLPDAYNGGIFADDSIAIDGTSQEIASLNGLNSSGLTGGGQIGFDYQIGRRFVVGVFGSYDLSQMDTTASIVGIDLDLIEKGDEWSIGARAGFLLHPRVMAYVLAAYTEAEWTFGDAALGGDKEVTFSGVTVGGGLEYAVTQNVFLGIEGTHTFYGAETIFDTGTDPADPMGNGLRIEDEIGETKVLGTLKIKLNADLGSSLGL